MPRREPPHPPDETADDVRAMLRAHDPTLTDQQIDRILGGPPPRRRRNGNKRSHWTAGVPGPTGGGSIVPYRQTRRRGRIRLQHPDPTTGDTT